MNRLHDNLESASKAIGVPPERIEAAMQRVQSKSETKEDRDILRHLVPPQKRPCGECNMCCTAPAIEDHVLEADENYLPKPACKECQFSNGKHGCGIYNDRPSSCKDYQCAWSMGLIPAKHYPMKRGVCWTFQPDSQGVGAIVVGHCLSVDDVVKDPYNIEIINGYVAMRDKFNGVTVRDSKEVICFMANGRGARADIDQSDPMKMEILAHTKRPFTYRFA